jgi:hypothetical protein
MKLAIYMYAWFVSYKGSRLRFSGYVNSRLQDHMTSQLQQVFAQDVQHLLSTNNAITASASLWKNVALHIFFPMLRHSAKS